MTLTELMSNIQAIREHILSLPFGDDLIPVIEDEQKKLEHLLHQVKLLTEVEREQVKKLMISFSEDLTSKMRELEEKMSYLKDEVDSMQRRKKSLKAYSGITVFTKP